MPFWGWFRRRKESRDVRGSIQMETKQASKGPHSVPSETDKADAKVTSLVKTLLEHGYRIDVLDVKPYFEAVDRLAEVGEAALPVLLGHLGESRFIAFALGRIGTAPAIDALGRELISSDWRRVEAAARGLGMSRSPSAKPYLQDARGGRLAQSVAEVHEAIEWAMKELYASEQLDKSPKVDKANIWQQIQSIPTNLSHSADDNSRREQAIALWKAIVEELPNIEVRVPGRNYSASDAKARAWS